MRKNKKVLKTQRHSLDEKLKAFRSFDSYQRPKYGWIKAIRESLGMTVQQLARRMKISPSVVSALEGREITSKATLESIEKAAHAMNCEFIYFLLPKDSLEKMVDKQSIQAATEILNKVGHHMKLEKQGVSPQTKEIQIKSLAYEIKEKLDTRLWSNKK